MQTTRPLSYKTHLKITTAKYYIPSGRCIQALDYTHRNEDGSVGYVPDSLISEFKTKNGRIVYDGGGIRPDVAIDIKQPANITFSLFANNLIFDFATLYAAKNLSLDPPGEFEISDEVYNEFLEFLEDKIFDYNTQSNDKLDEIVNITKQEGYYRMAKDEIDALREKLRADKNKDLLAFSDEIKELLRDEIVSRYYYQRGRIISGLKNDVQLDKAIELLKTPTTVSSILMGVSSEGDIKLALDK